MHKYVNPITGILLFYAAIMLIFNQDAATHHLVESGLLGWQASRLLVFFLPGVQIILALLLSFQLSLLKYVNWLLYLVLLVHLADLTIYFMNLGNADLVYADRMLFDPTLDLGSYLIIALLTMNVYSRISDSKPAYRVIGWYFYLFTLPLLGAGIIESKIYYTDFLAEDSDVPTGFSVEKLRKMTGITDEKGLVVLFDPSCHECQNVAKQMSVMNTLSKPDIHAVFHADESSIRRFLDDSGLDCQVHIIDYEDFVYLIDGVPNAYLIENNELLAHRIGYYINMRLFDQYLGL